MRSALLVILTRAPSPAPRRCFQPSFACVRRAAQGRSPTRMGYGIPAAPAKAIFVPAGVGVGKTGLQEVSNPGRLSRYAAPTEAQRNKALRLEVEVSTLAQAPGMGGRPPRHPPSWPRVLRSNSPCMSHRWSRSSPPSKLLPRLLRRRKRLSRTLVCCATRRSCCPPGSLAQPAHRGAARRTDAAWRSCDGNHYHSRTLGCPRRGHEAKERPGEIQLGRRWLQRHLLVGGCVRCAALDKSSARARCSCVHASTARRLTANPFVP